MKDTVREKLDLIDELFPEERISASKRRYESIWSGRMPEDRLPWVCYPMGFDYYNDYNAVLETDKRLDMLLDECILHGRLQDDFVPSLFPGCRQSTIPNMFGADEIVVGGDYSCERILYEIDDVDNLPRSEMGPGTVAHDWLTRQKHWLHETDRRIPIHVTDMQGPIDVCGQLWGYDQMFMAAYSDPEKLLDLYNTISRAFIAFWTKQQALLGSNFVGTHLFGWSWIPDNVGATLSADSMVMVSPDYFDRFFAPALAQITDEFRGIIVHSCGNFSHLVGNLANLNGLRGINASQMSLEQLQDAGLPNSIVAIYVTDYENMLQDIERATQTSQMVDITIDLCKDLREKCPVSQWTQSDWDIVYRRQDLLLANL